MGKTLLEKRHGWDVGRDPRRLSRDDLIAAGHQPMSPIKALRARCLDCCSGSASEVRLCTSVACPSWPFRMGSSPWRPPASEAQMEARRAAGARLAQGQSGAHNTQVENAQDAPAAGECAPVGDDEE